MYYRIVPNMDYKTDIAYLVGKRGVIRCVQAITKVHRFYQGYG